jgi:pilus assembly protein FimV
MKKSQRDTFIPTEDFEDLTLFANESFDTQDVDLFEFTSEESSPLTRLKSIILSLDWEINDEILQELADELVSLQAMWLGDKVAEVYLQGLAKIGNYIRTKGAYAHPNSIKLLLTFFYNFEKIISSPTITGDQITQLLKGDVRKFKILQYQISQSEPGIREVTSLPLPPEQSDEQPPIVAEEPTFTQQLKASILSLDWEVTEESLKQFNATLASCHQQVTDNKPALVLLQGLQALGDYIAEERANSHPDAFLLLHSFSEALEQVIQSGEQALDQNDIQDLLVDRINRLNNLKMVIASPGGDVVDEQLIADVVEEISDPAAFEREKPAAKGSSTKPVSGSIPATTQPVEQLESPMDTLSLGAEIDSIFGMDAKPAMETSELQYPDEILPPDAIHPVDDELADGLIDANLSSTRGLTPALADADEAAGFNAEEATFDLPDRDDLAEQLDFLFADTVDAPEQVAQAAKEPAPDDDTAVAFDLAVNEPIAALADVDFSVEQEEEQPMPELLHVDDASVAHMLDIENKLDSFFAEASDQLEQPDVTDAKVDVNEQSLFFDEPTSPLAALSESTEQGGFSADEAIAALEISPLDEIESKLDFFFGSEPEDQAPASSAESSYPNMDDALPVLETPPQDAGESQVSPAPISAHQQTEGELEDALDMFFASAEGTAPPEDGLTETLEATLSDVSTGPAETRHIQLATLGVLLPQAIRRLDRTKITEAEHLLASFQQGALSGEHQALTQLLHSVVTMLKRLPAKDASETEKLVNYLYHQLNQESVQPSELVEAIGRFSRWLQQAGSLLPLVPSTTEPENGGQPQEPQFHYTAKELYFELAELRSHMKEEFAKLRHEIHHHH